MALLGLLVLLTMASFVIGVILIVASLVLKRPNKGKKITLYSVIVFFLLLVVSGFMQGDADDEQVAVENAEASKEEVVETPAPKEEVVETPKLEEEEEKEEEPAEVAVGLNEPLQVGDAEFIVTGVRTATSISHGSFEEPAQGVFLILSVTYKNLGNEAATVDNDYFKLKYAEKIYESDQEGNSSLYNENTLFYERVNPDMSYSGDVVFDVTQEVAAAQGLQVQVQTGFWGTETGLITIQ